MAPACTQTALSWEVSTDTVFECVCVCVCVCVCTCAHPWCICCCSFVTSNTWLLHVTSSHRTLGYAVQLLTRLSPWPGLQLPLRSHFEQFLCSRIQMPPVTNGTFPPSCTFPARVVRCMVTTQLLRPNVLKSFPFPLVTFPCSAALCALLGWLWTQGCHSLWPLEY